MEAIDTKSKKGHIIQAIPKNKLKSSRISQKVRQEINSGRKESHKRVGRVILVFETGFSVILAYDFGGMESLIGFGWNTEEEETILNVVLGTMKVLGDLEKKGLYHLCLGFDSIWVKLNEDKSKVEDLRIIGWINDTQSLKNIETPWTIGHSPLELFQARDSEVDYSKVTVFSMFIILFELYFSFFSLLISSFLLDLGLCFRKRRCFEQNQPVLYVPGNERRGVRQNSEGIRKRCESPPVLFGNLQ